MRTKSETLNLDKTGFTASILCAIHCAGMPYLVALAPLAGLKFLANPLLEYSFILFSVLLAFASLSHGYRKHHRRVLPFALVSAGFAMIALGQLAEIEMGEIVFTTLGATVVAVAHLTNLRLVKKSEQEYA